MPASELARRLTTSDLELEIAVVIVDTARETAARLIATPNDFDAESKRDTELAVLRGKTDLLSRSTLRIYSRMAIEKQAEEDRRQDALLAQLMLQ